MKLIYWRVYSVAVSAAIRRRRARCKFERESDQITKILALDYLKSTRGRTEMNGARDGRLSCRDKMKCLNAKMAER